MRTLSTLAVLLVWASCVSPRQEEIEAEPEAPRLGVWMGMQETDVPMLLAPDILSSSLDEYNSTFSPDGKEIYFTTNTPNKGVLCSSKMKQDGTWSEPRVLPFSGEFSEYDPLLSPDGKRLFFSSERPLNDSIAGRTHVWSVDRNDDGSYGQPQAISLSGNGDYHSSVTADGRIFFNVWNNGDMFEAIPEEDGYRIERLPDTINSENGEGDPFILPDGKTLIYRGYNGSLGAGDLYITFRREDGSWTNPKNLGTPVNSDRHEMCPTVTPDGRFFVWSSSRLLESYVHEAGQTISMTRDKHSSGDNGQLNLYYISADFIEEFRDSALGETP